jgi:hypothetical protein
MFTAHFYKEITQIYLLHSVYTLYQITHIVIQINIYLV